MEAQIIDSELTAKLLGRGVAVSPVVTVEPRRRKFHKAITLSMPAPRPHTQGMTNQYSTSSAPTLRLLCSISGGTNRAHWEDVTDNTPLTFVNDCVSFTTTVSARYWLIDCRHVEDATKMATELYKEAIHVPFIAKFVVYSKKTEDQQAQLRMFCVTDDKEDKTLERIERYSQVAKSKDVEVHEGKPCYLEFAGNLVPVAKSGEQLSVPFRAFRENRLAFPVMVKSAHTEPVARCQFMREPKVPKGEPSPAPICILNIMVPEETVEVQVERATTPIIATRNEEQELLWRQRLSDPSLEDICNLLGKDWVALAYELGVSVATVNQIQAKRITAAEQAQLMLKLWKTQSGTKAKDNSLELALCRIGRDDIIAPQSEVSNERRIQRNIYQERQASEEIEAYKAEEDNKLKERFYDDNQIPERMHESEHDQDEAKYSPEEKAVHEKSEIERTPSPSEDSEEDEDVKRSVAERKEQITRKLSSSKIPASKQKKEIREEIIEIKTQIKPDIKKFHEQQVKEKEPKMERTRSKTSPESLEEEKEIEILRKELEGKKEEPKPVDKPVEQFRKFDPSSPAKPTPKHLQRHMRNESMRFPSGDFSNVTITPRKSVTAETSEIKLSEQQVDSKFTTEMISQKEFANSQVEEKIDNGERSPDLIAEEEKDAAEAPLKEKINSFESKFLKESSTELPSTTVKLTREALKKHTMEQDQGNEYTHEFVREQSKQISSIETTQTTQKVSIETEKHVETVKSVKETIHKFDSKIPVRVDEKKTKSFPSAMRTDSTLVQVSSEEDSEFLKKSTDSETETESQTTVKVDKEIKMKDSKFKDFRPKHTVQGKQKSPKDKPDDDDKKDDQKTPTIKEVKTEKILLTKTSEEKLKEVRDVKAISDSDIVKEKVETPISVVSAKSDISKHTKTDSMVSDIQDLQKISQESPIASVIAKTDSLADLQQSTERDVSFISQTESKVYSKDSKQRSDSLDEASQFSDLEDQLGSPAHKPIAELAQTKIEEIPSKALQEKGDVIADTRDFLEYEKKVEDETQKFLLCKRAESTAEKQTEKFLMCQYSTEIQPPALVPRDIDKIDETSPVISAKARQFIETLPEDDSVQECFFSKRIYSDSLEDSEQSDSRRHSEAESLKSDQSDVKAKISSSDFDERAEYEETVDSGSGFGDEKFEESVGFTSMKLDTATVDKTDSDSEKVESDLVFKKMVPRRHSRTESMSITKLGDFQLDKVPKKQEFQVIVTEAEEIDRSSDEPSDKISSESSREIELSEHKSSGGISDRISSEDAVTEKKTSSEEDAIKETAAFLAYEKDKYVGTIVDVTKPIDKLDTKIQTLKDDSTEKVEIAKRQSVTSAGSGSELRLEEKRLSDAYSLTESRDYTFEESEDDFGPQLDLSKEKVETKQDVEKAKVIPGKPDDKASKLSRLMHGDSLDDVEGFPEDHVIDHVHKLPHIAEVGVVADKDITSEFLAKEREEQLKRETAHSISKSVTESRKISEKDPVFFTSKETKTTYTVHRTDEPTVVTEVKTVTKELPTKTSEERIETTTTKSEKFDVSKIRSDTLIKYSEDEPQRKFVPKDLDLKETPEITKEQVKPVIDDILLRGSIAAAARSPVTEKDIKKDVVETEKRSYDAKAPHKEERRHSCVSPALSLERIAESDVETDEEAPKFLDAIVSETQKLKDVQTELKKSDSAMKQMADNIEIIIKQASEDVDLSSEEHPIVETDEKKRGDMAEKVSVDSIIEEAVTTVEEYLDKETKEKQIEMKKDIVYEETKKFSKERPALMKSLSRDSGEIVIMPKKKHPRTFSVQSSPDEVEEQIYTDSESDMDKAKVLEIIEPSSDAEGKTPATSFDTRKLRTDSLDDADDLFPEKEFQSEYFEDGDKYVDVPETFSPPKDKVFDSGTSRSEVSKEKSTSVTSSKKTHFVDSLHQSDIVSKSTTESSVTTVVSTLTKSSDEDQKSVFEDATSADFSRLSGADLIKDPSKTSMETKDSYVGEQVEERGTPDFSKKSVDLTKDYSKSSMDSKDTSRDFATNELSKDSTVDLTKDFSKASIESVRDMSKSIDEKTFSEDHSSYDVSKTLASDASEALTASKEFAYEDKSLSKVVRVSAGSSQGTSVMTESKIFNDNDEKVKVSDKTESDKKLSEFSGKSTEDKLKDETLEKKAIDDDETEKEDDVPDITELNRRCSNLLEDISHGTLIKVDSSHVTHDFAAKFSKTPPPSPVDLVMRDKTKVEDGIGDKQTGLLLKGSDSSLLDATRQSPRVSSCGDSMLSETEAHHSEVLMGTSKEQSAAARPKSPTRHLADNSSFVNVDQPTITSGAIELVDRTIEKSIDVIDQIKQEQQAVQTEQRQKSISSDIFYSESRIETSTSSSSVQKTVGSSDMQFQCIDPRAIMSDMVAKFSTTDNEYNTILTKKETETRKISGQEFFSQTQQVSSSDDDSLVIKTEMSHELRGQEHEIKEKTVVRIEGDQTETSQKKIEKEHEATAKRSDSETKTVSKTTDDTDVIKVEREFLEQGLYTGRQTKSEERMTAIKDESIKKKNEVKISERDMATESWGKEYFTEPGELQDIEEDEVTKAKIAFVESSIKIIEKDEIVTSEEVSEKGKVVSSTVEHHKEESVTESKEHDDLSTSDASHAPSFKSDTEDKKGSPESSPKSKSKSFNKDNEVYEVDFIKEIKVSTSPVKSTFSRTGSQETQSDSEAASELPHDDKTGDTPKKEKPIKSPVKLPQQQIQDQVWEVSLQKTDSFEIAEEIKHPKFRTTSETTTTKSSDSDTILELKTVVDTESATKTVKTDMSPSTYEITDEMSTTSKDIMMKSGESIDTEYMVKSLESHEGEMLQKSMDSTVSAETLQGSEFTTETDSAFLTGTATDHKREEQKLVKEKSLEDICSSGYDTDLSSAEFHASKLESERIDYNTRMSAQPLTDLSVLEKTIDEVKQSLEAAQGEIISEKSDGSSKYKQSPSEFQFKLLVSPDRPEVITEEHVEQSEEHGVKTQFLAEKVDKDGISDSQKSDSVLQKASSREGATSSDEDKDITVQQYVKESSPPIDSTDISIRSDSGPHSILETDTEIILSERDSSSKGSPEVKLRIQKQIKTKLGVGDRRSASEVEGWSSSGGSHYESFEHSESRPLSSDIEVMMTAQSGTEFETAMTSNDVSSRSLRTSKDYYTAASSLASRDSMKSLDSDGSSHVASIDISDASETLVPSANELKEELMESSTYVEQFLHEGGKDSAPKIDEDYISGDDEEEKTVDGELIGKMKRSHEMRFLPKEMIPEHFPVESATESLDIEEDKESKDGSDTTISSQFKTDILSSSSISKLDMPSSQSEPEFEREEVKEQVFKISSQEQYAIPFAVTKLEKPQREFVDIESEIIPVGSYEYDQIIKSVSITPEPKKSLKDETTSTITKATIHEVTSTPKTKEPEILTKEETTEVVEECVKKVVKEITVTPFPVTEIPPSKREFVDVESEIIPVGSTQYEEILKSKSDSSVPKTKVETSGAKTPDSQLDSKQSSTSSLKTHDHISTPHTPLSAPSQSSLSTENGREYVLDDIYDISETPELKSEVFTEGTVSRSELVVTTEDQTIVYEKEQESPTSDEFEMVDKPSEMDDFVVIEEVAKEAQETDTEGKSLQIKAKSFVQKHDTEVEEMLSKASRKQESTSSASGSLSDEELLQYELEQKRLQGQEMAELEAGKKWIQMQFEGDPRYDYERVPLEDIKEEEMTDFDASRIGSLSSQKESIGSYGSFRNSYGSLSESEMTSRIRFRVKGESDDISISSLQEFENLERALMEQYQQNSSSSQDSLNGSLPRRYVLSKSQGDDVSVSSLKEFEGLESACLEALKVELLAKQKEALLQLDPKDASCSFLEQEKRSYSGSSESSPPQKSGSPSQKGGSPSQKGGSPSQKVGSYGSPSQKLLAESQTIRRLIDQQMALEEKLRERTVPMAPKVVTVKKFDDRGAYFVPEPDKEAAQTQTEVTEECCKATSFICASPKAPKEGSAESIPGDCEEMMQMLEKEEKSKDPAGITRTITDSGVIEVVRTTTVIQQRFVDGKKVSESISSSDGDGAVDIPGVRSRDIEMEGGAMSFGSEMSSSIASQQSDMDSLMTVVEQHTTEGGLVTVTKQTVTMHSDKPEDLEFARTDSAIIRELSPSSGRSMAHSITSFSGTKLADPASGSWSGQDEELSSSGSFSRGARADLMLGSTDSLEATSSNATRATYNYEVDTPMTGSLTSGAIARPPLSSPNSKITAARPPGSNTMVSSLDTLDPVTAVNMESLEHASTSEHYSHDYEVQEPDSDTERLELDGSRVPRAKERTIMFDSTDTLSAVSGDGSVKEATVETAAPTFYIGDTPIVRGDHKDDESEAQPQLSGSCPASLPPVTQSSPPIPAQRRSISMISKSPPSSLDGTPKK